MTNRRNALKQMSKRYMRQQVLKSQVERQEYEEAGKPERLSEHHVISHARIDPINIFAFVQDVDPAKKVTGLVIFRSRSDHLTSHRTSFLNCRIICFVECLGLISTVMIPMSLPMKNATQYACEIQHCTGTAQLESTILLMIYAVTSILSTQKLARS